MGAPVPRLPNLVYAQASPRSVGGTSLFNAAADPVAADTVRYFTSADDVVRAAANRLGEAGFQVLQLASTTINIAGPPDLYQRYFGITLQAEERPVVKAGGL